MTAPVESKSLAISGMSGINDPEMKTSSEKSSESNKTSGGEKTYKELVHRKRPGTK
jgi:hypothetical protein